MANSTRDIVDIERLPQHVAIIMDGNGRWAKKRFMPRTMGHRAGMASLKKTVQACNELGIPILTVFAFSTENWKRPQSEVDYLMQLLIEFLHKEINELHAKNVRIKMFGDYKTIPPECQVEIKQAIDLTSNNNGLRFNIALNYGARQEIIDAAKKLALKIQNQEIAVSDLDEEIFSGLLYTGGMPDPDLLIRTAGEMRVSNFLLWQIAYAELVVTNTLWPDFTPQDLRDAIIEYQKRDRKFGGLLNRQDG
ncbi:Decaprenyl diphosphate synthase-like [Syntrophomonas zehnderi OL-4]|uniref:Isoprenyl transferase n=1 Tax=Syntrophomonas zehnderi OL-4 TaxID=690567 RepID=A0A0E3W3A3_9FIRM|nr:isoprenyl transferase [Syntrophomonas zehnderi]CFX66903.1 Decaprenyl diphosphate synthase-like [Syntrophomonas zehnderi OL-4]